MAKTLLEAVEDVLSKAGKPLNAKAIYNELLASSLSAPMGNTPWKTIGARLAEDIRSEGASKFMRVGSGLYALAEWTDLAPVEVARRKINPLDEDILVVERTAFERLKKDRLAGFLYDIHFQELLSKSKPIHRMKAEDDEGLVQLIPSFVIFEEDKVLSFRRTKKTPEQRLHDTYSIVFGGHLQAEDNPVLFADDEAEVERFLFRELHEELSFSPPLRKSQYVGVLHLEKTAFERQHAGVVFAIDLRPGTKIESLEPGYHSTLKYVQWSSIKDSEVMRDRWSACCVQHMLKED